MKEAAKGMDWPQFTTPVHQIGVLSAQPLMFKNISPTVTQKWMSIQTAARELAEHSSSIDPCVSQTIIVKS